MVTGVTDVSRDSDYSRTTTDPDIGLGSSHDSDITMVLGGKQAVHLSGFLASFTSSYLPLTTGQNHSVSHPCLPYPSIYLFTIILPSLTPQAAQGRHVGLLLLFSLNDAGQGHVHILFFFFCN